MPVPPDSYPSRLSTSTLNIHQWSWVASHESTVVCLTFITVPRTDINWHYTFGFSLRYYCRLSTMASSSPDASVPNPPLKDWERADKLNVEVVGYGQDDKRVIVRLHLPMDRNYERIDLATTLMVLDVKHSKDWKCGWCDQPARETQIFTLSWHHLTPPRATLYLYFVCSTDTAHVRWALAREHDYFNMVQGWRYGPFPEARPHEPGEVYPLAASCAFCNLDETAGRPEGLQRCSRCKMTRYCGEKCQKRDWRRHKVACGMVHSVAFENWE
ncbi:hypothetical protein C8Q78DRAFT_394474 [Trametes maxima]|nr:hypothetical protein C8Q78DRAFT_394474 [Trametes maxima]